MTRTTYTYNSAIVRRPGRSVANGLRAEDRGNPSYEGVLSEHQDYVAALQAAGLAVAELEPLEEFPDSIFVEDPALVFSEGAVVLRPGNVRRVGETTHIAGVLKERFDRVIELAEGGYADGGDILTTPAAVMIGVSARTDETGARKLADALATLGRKARFVATPPGVLHFKTDCSLLDDETVMATSRLANSDAFAGIRVLVVPQGEEAAANALRLNDVMLVSDDFPRTTDMLDKAGFRVVTLKTTEISKIDAGLSCMSLRWFDEKLQ